MKANEEAKAAMAAGDNPPPYFENKKAKRSRKRGGGVANPRQEGGEAGLKEVKQRWADQGQCPGLRRADPDRKRTGRPGGG
jgi:hypothetical protein